MSKVKKIKFLSTAIYIATAIGLLFFLNKATSYNVGPDTLTVDSLNKCYRRIAQLDNEGNLEKVMVEAGLFRIYYIHKHEGLELLLQDVTVPTFKLRNMATE